MPVTFGYYCLDTKSTKMNGSTDGASHNDIIRKISEDLNKKRLTDVEEGDENGDDADSGIQFSSPRRGAYQRDRKSSSASITSNTSLDTLWELHPRRLSEAGLRRTSDASIVLTEDTDSFIIGQRVWVGGTKPGQIAYIGDTQFAPGEWAGIVLDEPIGKNDGSVAGTRYFQCEARRGVFSRLTRLTRTPLPQAFDDCVAQYASSASSGKPPRRGTSPTGSSYSTTSSLRRPQQSMNTSSTSLASTPTVELKIGDRVIVRSSATTGSKAGILRFVGQTNFAPGEWCGVELDDPIGKNDGTVDGTRYFDCQPFYGLFAPTSKVSRSPSTRRPGNCVVHRTTIRRAGSRESLNSTTTSVVSSVRTAASSRVRLGVNSLTTPTSSMLKRTPPPKSSSTPLATKQALQDALREKEAQVVKLLKEKELERAEVTRAASQADYAEHMLASLKSEYEQYRKDCEIILKERDGDLCKIKSERDVLISQLDEERRRAEDLQFKFEEAAINTVDVEKLNVEQNVVNESHVNRIKELENLLSEERKKVETNENDSHKLFEAEEALTRTREELDKLQNELKVQLTSNEIVSTLKNELAEYKQKVETYHGKQNEIEDHHRTKLKSETEKLESQNAELNVVIEKQQKEIEVLRMRLAESEDARKKADERLKHQDVETSKLRVKIDKAHVALQEKTKDLCEKAVKTETKLQKEVDQLKMDVSSKVFDLEASAEKMKEKDDLIVELQVQLEAARRELKTKDEDIETHVRRKREAEQHYEQSMTQLKTQLEHTTHSFEAHKVESAKHLMARDADLSHAYKQINSGKSHIAKLEYDLNHTRSLVNSAKSSSMEYERSMIYVQEKDAKILQLNQMYETTCHQLAECHDVTSKQELEIHQQAARIETYKRDFETLNIKLKTEEDKSCNLTAKLNNIELVFGDMTRKFKTSQETIAILTQQKHKLEMDIKNLLMTTTDSKAMIAKLNEDLRNKEREFERFREEARNKLHMCERHGQELQQKFSQANMQWQSEKARYEQQIIELNSKKGACENQLMSIKNEFKAMTESLTQQLRSANEMCEQKQVEWNSQLNAAKKREESLNVKISEIIHQKDSELQEFSQRLQVIQEENMQVQVELKEKNSLYIELQAKCERIQASSRAKEQEIRVYFESEIKKLTEDIRVHEKRIIEKDTMLNELNFKINVCMQENQAINSTAKGQLKMLENTRYEMMKIQQDYQNVHAECSEKERAISNLKVQVNELTESKSRFEVHINQLNVKVQQATQELKVAKQETNRIQQVCGEKDQRIMRLQNEFEMKSQEACRTLQVQIDSVKQQQAECENKVVVLQSKNSEKELEHKTLIQRMEETKQYKCQECEANLLQITQMKQSCEQTRQQEQQRCEQTRVQEQQHYEQIKVQEQQRCEHVKMQEQQRCEKVLVQRVEEVQQYKCQECETNLAQINQIKISCEQTRVQEQQRCEQAKVQEKQHYEQIKVQEQQRCEHVKVQEQQRCEKVLVQRVEEAQQYKCQECETSLTQITQMKQSCEQTIVQEQQRCEQTRIQEQQRCDQYKVQEQQHYEQFKVQEQQRCEQVRVQEQQRCEKINVEIVNLQNVVRNYEESKTAAEQRVSVLQQQYNVLMSEKEQLQVKCMEVESQVASLNASIAAQPQMIAQQCQQYTIKITDLETKVENYVVQMSSLKNDIQMKEATIKRLEADIVNIQQTKGSNFEHLQIQIAQKEQEIMSCRQAKDREVSLIMEQLQAKIREFQNIKGEGQKCDMFMMEIEQKSKVIEQKNQMIFNLNQQISNMNLELSQKQKVIHVPVPTPAPAPVVVTTNSNCAQYIEQIDKLKMYAESASSCSAELHREKMFSASIETKLQKLAFENNDLMTKLEHFMMKMLSSGSNANVAAAGSTTTTGTHTILIDQTCEKQRNFLMAEIQNLRIKIQTVINQLVSCRAQAHSNTEIVTETVPIITGNVHQLEEAQSQIAFLNSIIVDMQQKNQVLMVKIQELEASCSVVASSGGGVSVGNAYELRIHGMLKPHNTPRLYCDICEMFDLHETEDCPNQSNHSSPIQNQVVIHHKPSELVALRPYCEICEVFGHTTENCDDAETF